MILCSEAGDYRANYLSVSCLPYDLSYKYGATMVEYIVAANILGCILSCLKPELWWRAEVFLEADEDAGLIAFLLLSKKLIRYLCCCKL